MTAKQEHFWLFAGKSHSSFLSPPQYRQCKVQFQVGCEHNTTGKRQHKVTTQHCRGCKANSQMQLPQFKSFVAQNPTIIQPTLAKKPTNQPTKQPKSIKKTKKSLKKAFLFFPFFLMGSGLAEHSKGLPVPKKIKNKNHASSITCIKLGRRHLRLSQVEHGKGIKGK